MSTPINITSVDDLIDIIYNKYHGISRVEINRIIKSEFKLLQQECNTFGGKSVNMIYLGKFKPTPYRKRQIQMCEETGKQPYEIKVTNIKGFKNE